MQSFKVSGSKIWQTERSCMCCQEMGEKEATVALFCPKAAYDEPKVRKVGIVIKLLLLVFVKTFFSLASDKGTS